MKNICFIDFETSGINVFKDGPVEFGAVLVDQNWKIIKKFDSRIKLNPKIPISDSALAGHGLTHASLEKEPTPKIVLKNFFSQFGTDYRFAGWNISFDVTFFRRLCNQYQLMDYYNRINHRHVDIQSINYLMNELKLYSKEITSLSDLVDYFGLARSNHHSALEDALLTFEVFKKIMTALKNKI